MVSGNGKQQSDCACSKLPPSIRWNDLITQIPRIAHDVLGEADSQVDLAYDVGAVDPDSKIVGRDKSLAWNRRHGGKAEEFEIASIEDAGINEIEIHTES